MSDIQTRKRLLAGVASLRQITAESTPKRLDPPATTAELRVKLSRVNPKLRTWAKDLGESLHFKPKRVRVTAPTA
jgi:hypothetical protein